MNHTKSYLSESKTHIVNGVVQHSSESVKINNNGKEDGYQSTTTYDPTTKSYVHKNTGNKNLSTNVLPMLE